MMKQVFLYFLLLFIINFVDSVYGIQRYWALENDGKTYIAMNMLNENINLTFPKETTFSRIAFDFRIYSPTQNQGCPDADNFRFKLFIGHENYVRGAVLSDAYYHLYEKCGDAESQYPIMAGRNNGLLGLRCFKNGNPFLLSDKDNSKSVMELQISGSFPCQIYMILPSYMGIEDKDDDVVASMPNNMKHENLPLNNTFNGHNESFWWKTDNDEMLPSSVSFNESSKNIQIDILNSTKEIPYFFRIGLNQSYPSLKFIFGKECNGSKFELFLNLHDSDDCKIEIDLIENGYNISTKEGIWNGIIDSSFSPTFEFYDENKLFIKVSSPVSINKFETCQFTNTLDVPADQFVLQLSSKSIVDGCDIAQVILSKNDIPNAIEVLINRTNIIQNFDTTTTNPDTIISTSNSTTNEIPHEIPNPEHQKSAANESFEKSALIPWWWFLIGGILLIIAILIIILAYCIHRRRRRKQIPQKNVSPKKLAPVPAPKSSEVKTAILKEAPKQKSKEVKKKKKKSTTLEKEVSVSMKNEKPKPKPSSIKPEKQQQLQPSEQSPKLREERSIPIQGSDDSKNDKSSTVKSTTIMIHVESPSNSESVSKKQPKSRISETPEL